MKLLQKTEIPIYLDLFEDEENRGNGPPYYKLYIAIDGHTHGIAFDEHFDNNRLQESIFIDRLGDALYKITKRVTENYTKGLKQTMIDIEKKRIGGI
jgi:hypothetical protein